jgi:ribonuclease D
MPANSSENTQLEYLDQTEAVGEFCDSIRGVPWIALDTEFIREKTYYPKLCLIQIGVPGRTVCIDPLANADLTPVFDILYDRSIVKVLHACSQDLEIFVHLKGRVPGPIFDTQLAAPLLGLPDQIGYGNFVREMLGLSLDKAQARTDWSHRPLSQSQLRYAGDDVRFLAEIYPQLKSRLEQLGRLAWLKDEFEPYERVERYLPDPDNVWKRIRGADRLRPAGLAVLQTLANWREQVAQQKDLPRNWILKDDTLLDIARLAPDNFEKLAKIRSLPPKTLDRYGEKLIELVREGKHRPPEPLPGGRKRAKPSAQEEALADILHAQLRLLADKHQINNTVLASRKELIALAQGEEELDLLRGWRREMAGIELLAMLGGQRVVSISKKRVVITPGSES